MSQFSETICRVLHDYKVILKRNLTPEQKARKVAELKIGRTALRKSSDVVLYHKAEKVLGDLEVLISVTETSSWYSGMDEFRVHLKNILSEYTIEGKKVTHAAQKASRALVGAIQLLLDPARPLSKAECKCLDTSGETIVRYGSKEQKLQYVKALKKRQDTQTGHVINTFEQSLLGDAFS